MQAYAQHKVQSLCISLLTMGVGSLLSAGATGGKAAAEIGLATASAVGKAIFKETMLGLVSGVANHFVSMGADALCDVLIKEIGDKHFGAFFDNWQGSDPQHQQKIKSVENIIDTLYNSYGMGCKACSLLKGRVLSALWCPSLWPCVTCYRACRMRV